MKKVAIQMLKDHPNTHPNSIKEQHNYACMLAHLHNGNREKFEEYKNKTQEAMSEILTMLMERGDHKVNFVQETDRNWDEMLQFANESTSLRQANKMKIFATNVGFYELRAEFVDRFKTPATKNMGCAAECDLTTKKPKKTNGRK